MNDEQHAQLQDLLATHSHVLQDLLGPHWPVRPFEVKQYGPLTKYTLGQMPDGRWAHLHYLNAPDEGAMHDHPCDIESIGIKGSYLELRRLGNTNRELLRRAGTRRLIPAKCVHIIVWVSRGGCWTLCLTGPVVNEWKHYPELDMAA